MRHLLDCLTTLHNRRDRAAIIDIYILSPSNRQQCILLRSFGNLTDNINLAILVRADTLYLLWGII